MTINYSLLDELIKLPGVVATGGFTYRGDQTVSHGQINDTEADTIAKTARSMLEILRMQGDMLQMFTAESDPSNKDCGLQGGKGFAIRGPLRTICVISNAFCIINNKESSATPVLRLMLERQADAADVLI